MQTEWQTVKTLIRASQPDLGLNCLPRHFCPNHYGYIYSKNVMLQSSTRYERIKEVYLILYITKTLRALQVY